MIVRNAAGAAMAVAILQGKNDGRPVKPLGCFVGEPTQMGVVIGHKGKRSVRARVRGFTCHSSLAPQGVNAAEFAALLVAYIRGLADRLAVLGRLIDVVRSVNAETSPAIR